MSSNSVPLVAVTSSVCGRRSFGGGRRPFFQEASFWLEGLPEGMNGENEGKMEKTATNV